MGKVDTHSSKYSARNEKFFNIWRKLFQNFVTQIVYKPRFKLVYRIEIIGKENIPKDNKYIVTSNHLSTLDPVVMGYVFDKPIAYMSKKELFINPIMRTWLDWLGGFAVDREKLSVSTIKTALSIQKTKWVLGIFPQGKREEAGTIKTINKGFAAIAKAAKCGVIPVGITGTQEAKWLPFSGKITVKIGKLIPYSDNPDELTEKWIEEIQNLTGFKYCPEE